MAIARSRLLRRRNLLSGEEGDYAGDWQAQQTAQDSQYVDAYGTPLHSVMADIGVTSGEAAGNQAQAFVPLNDLTATPVFMTPILSTMEIGGQAGPQELQPAVLESQAKSPNTQTVYTPEQTQEVYQPPKLDYTYGPPIADYSGAVVTEVSSPTPAPIQPVAAPAPAPSPSPAPIQSGGNQVPEITVPLIDAPVITSPAPTPAASSQSQQTQQSAQSSNGGGLTSITLPQSNYDSGQYIPTPGTDPSSGASGKSILGPALIAILGAFALFQG